MESSSIRLLYHVWERLLEMSNGERKVADIDLRARLDELRMIQYRALEELAKEMKK